MPSISRRCTSLYMEKVGTNVIGLWRWCLNHLLAVSPCAFLPCRIFSTWKSTFCTVFSGHLSTYRENWKFLFSLVMFHLSHCSFREAEADIRYRKWETEQREIGPWRKERGKDLKAETKETREVRNFKIEINQQRIKSLEREGEKIPPKRKKAGRDNIRRTYNSPRIVHMVQGESSSVSLMDILQISTVFQKECLMPVTGLRISSSHLISSLVPCPFRKRGRWIQCELHKDMVNKSSKASESEKANGGWLCTKEEALLNYISKFTWCLTISNTKAWKCILGDSSFFKTHSTRNSCHSFLSGINCLLLFQT